MTRLPEPNGFGNYYLTADAMGPAVFCSLKRPGQYFASRGCGPGRGGVLLGPGGIQYFRTPHDAVRALGGKHG